MSGGFNEIHPEPTTFLSKYIISFDHKVIAKQFLWYGIFFLGLGGMMAILIRWGLMQFGYHRSTHRRWLISVTT